MLASGRYDFLFRGRTMMRGGADQVAKLTVKYDFTDIRPGMKMSQMQSTNRPLIYYPVTGEQEESGLYTLLMVDPDAPFPENPFYREWIQWMVVNIPGNRINLGQEILPYQATAPDRGTHRYYFYLYDQQGQELPPNLAFQRKSFNRAEFVNSYQMRLVAQNHFLVDSLNQGVPLNV